MNITRMRYFIAVAQCGSFSEAARRLFTVQPNLSKQITQMEQELGFTLFIRTRRSVKLTPAGEYLYKQIKELPEELDEIFETARSIARRGEGAISIGVLEGQNVNHILSRRLERINSTYPQLQLSLERNSYATLRSGLKSGHYDLIITLDFDVADDPEYAVSELYSKQPAIVLHRNNPLSAKADLTLTDLVDEDFVVISRNESPGGYDRLMTSCADAGFVPHVVREPLSLESLLLCVEMGIGIAVLDQNTRLAISPDIVTIPQNARPMSVVVATLKGDSRPLVKTVAELLTQTP